MFINCSSLPYPVIGMGGIFFIEERGMSVGACVHKISMVARRKAAMNGVVEVLSFDDREIVLDTTEGMLVIRGEGLHVNRLTVEKGEVDID